MAQDEIYKEFKRQVKLCYGLGQELMIEIVKQQFCYCEPKILIIRDDEISKAPIHKLPKFEVIDFGEVRISRREKRAKERKNR